MQQVYTSGENMEYVENTMRTLVFDILFPGQDYPSPNKQNVHHDAS